MGVDVVASNNSAGSDLNVVHECSAQRAINMEHKRCFEMAWCLNACGVMRRNEAIAQAVYMLVHNASINNLSRLYTRMHKCI